jgi:ketosteroid isomerase-like protein
MEPSWGLAPARRRDGWHDCRVGGSHIETVRAGLEAYRRGDIEAIGELLAPDVRWDGGAGADPCLDRETALAAMRASAPDNADLELADAVPFGTDKVMVCLVRPAGADAPERVYQVVTFGDDGKVARLQGFAGRKQAVQAARGVTAGDAGGGAKQGGGARKRPPWRRFRMAVGRLLGRG